MLKKLQRKFILINMSLVTLVLLVVLTTFCAFSLHRFYMGIQGAMDMALSDQLDSLKPQLAPSAADGSGQPDSEHMDFPPNGEEMQPKGSDDHGRNNGTPVVTITLGEDQEIDSIDDSGATIETATAQDAVDRILSSEDTSGRLSDLKLYYRLVQTEDGTRIALADYSQTAEMSRNTILISLVIFMGATIAFFFISVFLSRLALRPVEKAWEQQQQFVADASHELKTPLTVILANLDILSSHPEDTIAQQSRWLTNTKAEADRMKSLLDDLLFLAKSDADTIPLSVEDFDLSQTVLSCILLFESVAYEQQVTLTEDITAAIHFLGSEQQCKQVIAILLDNACKYAKGGSIHLTLTSNSEKIQLSVYNSGPVISEEEQAHIFERFYRSDKSRVRKEGGYGLGLSIAHTIVNNHKGTIQVSSNEKDGTTFTVTLPANCK